MIKMKKKRLVLYMSKIPYYNLQTGGGLSPAEKGGLVFLGGKAAGADTDTAALAGVATYAGSSAADKKKERDAQEQAREDADRETIKALWDKKTSLPCDKYQEYCDKYQAEYDEWDNSDETKDKRKDFWIVLGLGIGFFVVGVILAFILFSCCGEWGLIGIILIVAGIIMFAVALGAMQVEAPEPKLTWTLSEDDFKGIDDDVKDDYYPKLKVVTDCNKCELLEDYTYGYYQLK